MLEWHVHEDYEISDNGVRPIGEVVRSYHPPEDFSLVRAVLRLRDGDEGGLLDFARTWGLLEHDEEKRLSNIPPWIWGHARNFRLVLDLCEYSWKRNWSGLRRFLEPYHRRFESIEADDRPVQHDELQVPVAYPTLTQVYVIVPYPTDDDKARLAAESIIARTLSANLTGLHYALEIEPLRLAPRASCLLDLAYWLLANGVVGPQRRQIVRCVECGNFFVQTDRRQRFCPPEGKGKQSACGARFRKRRQRQKKGG